MQKHLQEAHTHTHRVTRRQTQAQGTLSLPRTQNVCTMLLACDAMYRSVVNKEFFRYNEFPDFLNISVDISATDTGQQRAAVALEND